MAVHAVAGQRENYRPLAFCDGDPIQLIDHYHRVGVESFYVADLSAIQSNTPQTDALIAIAATASETMIDIGWRDGDSRRLVEAVGNLARSFPRVSFIAATESCTNIASLSDLANLVGGDRTWLGLDFHTGRLLGCESDENAWVSMAVSLQLAGLVVLDLSAVGVGLGPVTDDICRRVSKGSLRVVSGGGVRHSDDADRLFRCGCEGVLIATALHPK